MGNLPFLDLNCKLCWSIQCHQRSKISKRGLSNGWWTCLLFVWIPQQSTWTTIGHNKFIFWATCNVFNFLLLAAWHFFFLDVLLLMLLPCTCFWSFFSYSYHQLIFLLCTCILLCMFFSKIYNFFTIIGLFYLNFWFVCCCLLSPFFFSTEES